MKEVSNITNSLAHTKRNCKYHIVFAPKYRRKVFYEEKRLEIREILRKSCQWKGIDITEGEICPDHIHMLVSIPPKMSVSGFMGYLKRKSSLMIFQKWGNMKFAYRNREFWCKGYYVDTVTYFYGHCILMMIKFCGNNTCKSRNHVVFSYQGYVRVKLQFFCALRQFAYFTDFYKPVLIHFIFQTFGQIY